MKNVVLIGFLSLMGINAFGLALSAEVVAEHVTVVGFAPPEHRGIFKTQILASGVVQIVNNKNKTTVVAHLTTEVLKKITSAIDSIKSSELSRPTEPPCMDAPSQAILVRQSSGVNMTIWKQTGCREHHPADAVANRVAGLVNNLENSFSSLDYLQD